MQTYNDLSRPERDEWVKENLSTQETADLFMPWEHDLFNTAAASAPSPAEPALSPDEEIKFNFFSAPQRVSNPLLFHFFSPSGNKANATGMGFKNSR